MVNNWLKFSLILIVGSGVSCSTRSQSKDVSAPLAKAASLAESVSKTDVESAEEKVIPPKKLAEISAAEAEPVAKTEPTELPKIAIQEPIQPVPSEKNELETEDADFAPSPYFTFFTKSEGEADEKVVKAKKEE